MRGSTGIDSWVVGNASRASVWRRREEKIHRQARVLAALEKVVERLAERGRLQEAMIAAEAAAHVAWWYHPGRFHSARLERILIAAGDALPRIGIRRTIAARQRRVLHVVSVASGAGGHRSLLTRWIRRDRSRRHDLFVSRPCGVDRRLREVVAISGGVIWEVERWLAPLERAAALRRAASGAELVVLHTHPDDAVPLVALGTVDRPPVLFVNHADHCFWLGRAIADVVCCLRHSATELAVKRRRIPRRRIEVLPLPIEPPGDPTHLDRRRARRALGVPDAKPLVVTVASEWKLVPVAGLPSSAQLALRLAERVPELHMLFVGPRPTHPVFSSLAASTAGRVRALGETERVAELFAGADLYVDSAPVASLTSLLEAVAAGLPAVSMRLGRGEAGVVWSDHPWLEGELPVAEDEAAWREKVIHLVTDPQERENLSRRLTEMVSAHADGEWLEVLERIYSKTHECGSRVAQASGEESPEEPVGCETVDLLLAAVQMGRDTPVTKRMRNLIKGSTWTYRWPATAAASLLGAVGRIPRFGLRLQSELEEALDRLLAG
ncbi:MAG: hypothetical protein KatS3mg008_0652 [Acidimicrobiales bacterium]|nr:MAG: hypothetical protein KatS3mg008_0652 [Acidimicrobiales bacterium]